MDGPYLIKKNFSYFETCAMEMIVDPVPNEDIKIETKEVLKESNNFI